MPVTTADLPEPYQSMAGADDATASAREQIRSAIRASPGNYQATDAAIAAEPELAALLLHHGIALAVGHLTQGRAGVGQEWVRRASRARSYLRQVSEGAVTLTLAHAAVTDTAGRRSLAIVGERESPLHTDMWDAYANRGGGG